MSAREVLAARRRIISPLHTIARPFLRGAVAGD